MGFHKTGGSFTGRPQGELGYLLPFFAFYITSRFFPIPNEDIFFDVSAVSTASLSMKSAALHQR